MSKECMGYKSRDTKIFTLECLHFRLKTGIYFFSATLISRSQPGRYTFLEDIKTLRSVMATYYNLFALGKQLSPVVSVPYIDAFGTGTIRH